jgi:serine/threonine-protein kinase
LLGIAAVVALSACAYRAESVRAAKLDQVPAQKRYFPAGSIWTQDATKAPVAPNSSAIIDWLTSAGGWGHGGKMQVDFGIRVLQADAHTPTVPFHKGPGFYLPDSDVPSAVPMPPGGGMEGHTGYECPVDREDCHLIVADRDHAKLYEAWQANYSSGTLSSPSMVVWDLNRVYPPSGRGEQCTSADAAGFPIAPLLFNADELASGSINHAIRFILPNPRMRRRVYVHPASHAGDPEGPANAPPYGAHFRLKASFDLSQLSPPAQVVARALQKYGMFLADGGNVALTAQSDLDTASKYDEVGFGPRDLQALKVTDFEVLDSGTPISFTGDCVRNQ